MPARKLQPDMAFPFEGMARIFGVLADPTRLRLLQAMSLECKSVSQLVQESGVAQPLVSRHLRILRDAGLPPMRFHDLRHSAATLLLAMGVHAKVVQELLGHSTIVTTLNIYSHVLPSMH